MREFVTIKELGKNPSRYSRFFYLSSGFTLEIDEFDRVANHPEKNWINEK